MTRLRALLCAIPLVASLGFLAAGCSGGGHSVVGKWSRGNDQIYTFTKEGDLIKQEGAGREIMGYSVTEGTNLFLKQKERPTSLAYTISFPSENELVLTPQPPNGAILPPSETEPIRFERVRE